MVSTSQERLSLCKMILHDVSFSKWNQVFQYIPFCFIFQMKSSIPIYSNIFHSVSFSNINEIVFQYIPIYSIIYIFHHFPISTLSTFDFPWLPLFQGRFPSKPPTPRWSIEPTPRRSERPICRSSPLGRAAKGWRCYKVVEFWMENRQDIVELHELLYGILPII